eukprot:TRINITY_DN27751_c0_g1_i1.p1 TRINITY_DN27751_c0_g1~~TRINITY_DN27751_c0_g1_i1.p1  ORF type:complete len:510 (+),score=110.40 TRINITY_DN27751_c0_g1_i1:37-1530(+)
MPTTIPSMSSRSHLATLPFPTESERVSKISDCEVVDEMMVTRSSNASQLIDSCVSQKNLPSISSKEQTLSTAHSHVESVIEDEEWNAEIRDAISRLKIKNGYGGFKTDVSEPVFDLQVRNPTELQGAGSYESGRSVSGQSCRTNDFEVPTESRRMSVSTITSLDKTLAVEVEMPDNEITSMKSFVSLPPTTEQAAGGTTPSIQTKTVSFPPAISETPVNMPSPPPGSVITCNENEVTGDEVQTSLSALRTTLNALESQVLSAILPSDEDTDSKTVAEPDIDRQKHIQEMIESPHVPEERHSSPPVLNRKPWKVKNFDSKSKGWCCKLHDKEFTAWCYQSSCNKIVCPDCVKSFHVGHGLMKIPKQQEMTRNIQNIKDDDVLEEFDFSLFEAPQQMKHGFVQRAEMHRRNISAEYNLDTNVTEALNNIEQDTSGLFDEATKKIEYLTGKLNATTATWNTCRRRIIEPAEQEEPLFAAGYSGISDENRFLTDQIARATR